MDLPLKKIVDKRVVIPIVKNRSNCELTLLESSEESAINQLKITDIPDHSFAFTLDFNEVISRKGAESRVFRKLSAYLESGNGDGINKSCDLVIVSPESSGEKVNLKVIVLDLKSENAGARGCIQVENSVLFINYLLSLSHYHYDDKPESVLFYKRIITTSAVKNAIGKKGRDQQITHKISVKVGRNKKSNISFSRLIV
ncbi:hypothetical protein [Citrobacter portucalensis]|uniref:hypothetical protein n=1 Tax=Citrobacter portucalensis TaxID=1639133 RepID=UPI003BF51AF2